MDKYLETGYKLEFSDVAGTFEIKGVMGKGASCAVYNAIFTDSNGNETQHILKEYNPYYLDIIRNSKGEIYVDSEDDLKTFNDGMLRFETGYKRQIAMRKIKNLTNSTSNVQSIHYGYGTRYIDVTVFEGETYEKTEEKSLYNLLKRIKAIATVISGYHKAGFLHLDIKPENILTVPETCEMVMLFDFDSVTPKNEVAFNRILSYTKTWSALEQILPIRSGNICEATDIFSVGEILFYKIMGRHSTDNERRVIYKKYNYDKQNKLFENINAKIFGVLDEIFSKTIKNPVNARYASAEELIEKLDYAISLADPKEPFIVSTLPGPEGFFVGREQEINDIHNLLSTNEKLFVTGIGGIGKSELIKKYAERFEGEYDTITFIPYVTDLKSSFCDDKKLTIYGCERIEGETLDDYYNRKYYRFKSLCNKKTLLIIDNLDNENDSNLKDILELDCTVVFITRIDFSQYGYLNFEVTELENMQDVYSIFRQYCSKPLYDEEKVYKIIDLVNYHTMTVEVLAKQMSVGRIKPEQMLEKLQNGGLSQSGNDNIKFEKDNIFYSDNAYGHIKMIFDLSVMTKNELNVLCNLSLVPYTGIETETFYNWCNLSTYNDINNLVSGGYIRLDKEKDVISLHPVIADIALDELKKQPDLAECFVSSLSDYISGDKYDLMSLTDRNKYLSLCVNCSQKLQQIEFVEEFAMEFYGDVGNILRKQGDFITSEKMLLKAYGLCKSEYGVSNCNTAILAKSTGRLYIDKGEFEKAGAYLSEALGTRIELFGEFHADTANSYNNMAMYYRRIGKYEKAEECYLKALNIRVELFGENHIDTSTSYNNMAVYYDDIGKYEKAEECYLKALNIRLELFGEIHPKTATTYKNMAAYYKAIGNYEQAEEYYLKALNIRLELFGENHIDTAASYGSIAVFYKDIGEYEKAEECYLKALNIRLELFGENHIDTATSYSSMAVYYRKTGEYEKAEECYLKALNIRVELFGTENIHTARTYHNLGFLYKTVGEYNKAKENLQKAFEIRLKAFGEDHSATKKTQNYLDEVNQALNQD